MSNLYQEIQSESPQAAQYAYQFANEALAGKNRDLMSSLHLLRENLRKLNEESFAGFGFLCAAGVACIAFVTISMVFSSGPEKKGPFRVFTASQNMQINATREQIASGSSRRVMSENGDQITIRLDNGDRTLPRADLLRFGRLETGYVEDYTNTIGWFAKFFWRICIPIVVWIGASKLRREAVVSPVVANIARVEESIRIVTGLQQEAQNAIRAGSVPLAA